MTRAALLAIVLALGAAPAMAKPAKRAHKPAASRSAKTTDSAPSSSSASSDAPAETTVAAAAPATTTTTAGGKTVKTKTYTFGAMDVEGKLKTPQLLYFLNRVKLELDMSAPDKRSFMKELEQSADDKNL
jgi:hypothetical protein